MTFEYFLTVLVSVSDGLNRVHGISNTANYRVLTVHSLAFIDVHFIIKHYTNYLYLKNKNKLHER